MTEIEKTAEVLGEISNQTDKTIVTSFMGGIRIERGIKTMCQRKVPNYPFPERAISALEAMYKYTLWQKKSTPSVKTFSVQKENVVSIFDDVRRTARRCLAEEEARQVIAAYGFKIPKSILADSEAEAVTAAGEIGYPVV